MDSNWITNTGALFSEIWEAALQLVTDNPVLSVFLFSGIVVAAFGVFRSARNAAY